MLSTMQEVPLNISRILDYGARAFGPTLIKTWESGEEFTSTYRELAARAAALAHALADEVEIKPSHRVGTFMFNCTEHLETLFAVTCMGAVFNPLNKQLLNAQIAHIINLAEDQVIIADQRLAKQLGEVLSTGCPSVRAVIFIGRTNPQAASRYIPSGITTFSYEALLDGRRSTYPWPLLPENAAAALCYSTGTTGEPKGVVYSQRSLYLKAISLRTSDSLGISHGRTFLCCVPIYHTLSWCVPIAAVMSGAPLVFPGADLTPRSLAELIETTSPQAANGVPSIWIQVVMYYLAHPPNNISLREIFSGGSPVPPALMDLWRNNFGIDLVQIWGMTETSGVTTVARPPTGLSPDAERSYRITQGRFPAAVDYRVVNDGRVVNSTERHDGEIQVRGTWITGSYYHSSNEGSAVSDHPSDPSKADNYAQQFTEDGWLRTGDVGTVTADGFLILNDRARDVIRSGGEWIYSSLLENEIMSAPEVVECAVIGNHDRTWGERPLAITKLVADVDATFETADKLRDHLRETFPSWMLPEYWAFVENIAKTSVGKFDKIELRATAARGDLDIIKLPGPGSSRVR
ncbi:long-chain fatty-acid--CoA ligase [Corynebacterium sp. ES2794-CONJ1]|uniref:long-chain fatty-acid--CoA ligase n=1 Tax=unclassified Corynebacterium TaxID=2624378 RepID=UPI00216B5369|nr:MULTISPECIES: long-chain fatty-acid--CoA ligase [unclassified Corynebacterium]MCS4531909.1 long-chain fatty-acid--CoA ligase [Corynebacterium sp. ES2730-CONJ]MCU9519310.1 long-chain fatty-acid--CoA ligase [Corynebacterium sp. ES2794-CONJ1]